MASPYEWLPTERQWIESLASDLLDGRRILVRALPRWGLTAVCEKLGELLGESAFIICGRTFLEDNQSAKRDTIDREILARVKEHGLAQLVFDNYGHALNRTQSGALHSMLYRLLVDGASARDIGAIFVARPGDPLDPHFVGSPLLSRVESRPLPLLATADSDAVGGELDNLRRRVGDSTWLARRFLNKQPREAEVSITEHLNHDSKRIAASLPPAAVEVLRQTQQFGSVDISSQSALECLGTVRDNTFTVADLVQQSSLPYEVDSMSPGWPATFNESVAQFTKLLRGAPRALWVDRYVFTDPEQATKFINALNRSSPSELLILTSDDYKRPTLAAEIRKALGALSGVQVRFMLRSDRNALHDRHLVFPADKTGFTLPTAGVIVGRDNPGSTVSVKMPYLAFNYSAAWQRASRIFP